MDFSRERQAVDQIGPLFLRNIPACVSQKQIDSILTGHLANRVTAFFLAIRISIGKTCGKTWTGIDGLVVRKKRGQALMEFLMDSRDRHGYLVIPVDLLLFSFDYGPMKCLSSIWVMRKGEMPVLDLGLGLGLRFG